MLHRVVLAALQRRGQQSQRVWQQAITQYKLFQRVALLLQGVIISIRRRCGCRAAAKPGGDRHRRAGVDPRLHPAVAVLAVGYAAGAAAPKPDFNQLPLRGIFRGLKLVAAILIGIMIVSLLMGKSPLLLLSGTGAMTAVLMLVFRIRSSGWWPAFSSPPTIC